MSVSSELASLNALGNGAIGGSMGNAGQTTGQLASPGADIGMDATNSMGSAHAPCSPAFSNCEEPGDFTASKSASMGNGSMGRAI